MIKSIIIISIIGSFTFLSSCIEKSNTEKNENTESANNVISDSITLEENNLNLEVGFKTYESLDFENLGEELYNLESIGGIQIGQELNDVIMILGKPDSTNQEEFWGVDGGYHQYAYYHKLGLVIEFMRMEDMLGSFVQIIELNKTDLSTAKGINVGSHRNELIKTYAREIEFEDVYFSDSIIRFGEGTTAELMFRLKDEKVYQIYLGPTVRC